MSSRPPASATRASSTSIARFTTIAATRCRAVIICQRNRTEQETSSRIPKYQRIVVIAYAQSSSSIAFFFFKQKTAYEIGLGIPAEPLFRSTLFPILASLLVRLVVLLPFQLLRLSLATPSRWTPLALSVFLHCVVALLLTLL